MEAKYFQIFGGDYLSIYIARNTLVEGSMVGSFIFKSMDCFQSQKLTTTRVFNVYLFMLLKTNLENHEIIAYLLFYH